MLRFWHPMRHVTLRCLGVLLFVAAARIVAAGASTDEDRLVRTQELIQSGDLHGARGELQELLARLPADPRIHNLLGVIDAQENNFIAAESNFRRAIELAPGFTGAYLNLGRLYQEHAGEPGTVEKALKVYLQLLAFEPDHVEANYQAAALLNRQGRFNLSLAHLARLPDDAQQRASALAIRRFRRLGARQTRRVQERSFTSCQPPVI